MLLAEPIKEDLREQKDSLADKLYVVDSRSSANHADQQEQMNRFRVELDRMNEHLIQDAEDRGRTATAIEWLRRDDMDIKQIVDKHADSDQEKRALADPQTLR
jgi:hypothetical protein